jgi:TrmH family RNA methyltransferase
MAGHAPLITAFSNPLVKQVRGLRDKKHAPCRGLFMAEGLRILTEAREAGACRASCSSTAPSRRIPAPHADRASRSAGGDAIETNADILPSYPARTIRAP